VTPQAKLNSIFDKDESSIFDEESLKGSKRKGRGQGVNLNQTYWSLMAKIDYDI
jgi:hypothetical protein